MQLYFTTKYFSDLTPAELYAAIRLRNEVFVVEQNCVYQDIDGQDKEALHIIYKKEDKLVAYTRCFAPGVYFKEASIGRVVVTPKERNNNYGHQIMKTSVAAILTHYNTQEIKLSAQKYLEKFYNSHGFFKIGEGYLEDGIPHISMVNKTP